MKPILSVILPTFNEEKNLYLPRILASARRMSAELELIVVDGGSTDSTLEIIEDSGHEVFGLPGSTRADRLNHGFSNAQGEIVLFHHPRSLLEPDAYHHLIRNRAQIVWGGFTHSFDHKHPLLEFTSWYSNHVRRRMQSIIYLDHCIYFRKDLFQSGEQPVPAMDIFEDTGLCLNLRKFGRPALSTKRVQTSAIRFQKNGIFIQAALNQVLKLCYLAGASPEQMNKVYERGLSLNNKINKRD